LRDVRFVVLWLTDFFFIVIQDSTADHDLQNVDSERANLNGSPAADDIENKHITSVEEQLNSADPSVSGGSDTEASRLDPTRIHDDERGHARTSSAVKKPATFKAVSYNKTFLAAKGAAIGTATKIGDKAVTGSGLASAQPGASALSVSRPRLVAKTGSGARDSGQRFSSVINGGKAGIAPDPNAVWNKNRRRSPDSFTHRGESQVSLTICAAVPAPEPKKFTDEELRGYGIHMATRLPPDAASGQANWADIDDDDEDWAPETITFADGTKVNLEQPDEAPAAPSPAPEPAPAIATIDRAVDKPKSPAPLAGSSPSVKPGVLASGKGLILKSGGSGDKPTLVAKPPAPPTPVKSPWAALPPIDKASPAAADVHSNMPGSRLMGKDAASFKAMPPPMAKEIAPDDFTRSWRDGSTNQNRELFNSHSGRYEPVTDRRSSLRHDTHNRQPAALLQRSSQQDHPAEPSPAFQTHRAAQDATFGRRRGSSNVSGGSAAYIQRLVKAGEQPLPPPELLNARRGSLTGSTDSPVSPRNFSPSGQQAGPRLNANQPWLPRSSPGTNHANPYYAAPNRGPGPGAGPDGTVADANVVDDIGYQKKLMEERRRLARERKEAEEAREEEEKQKRIRKKLEELGPAPERKSEKKAAVTKEDTTGSIQIQQRDAQPGSEAAASGHASTTPIMKTSSLSEGTSKAASAYSLAPKSNSSTENPSDPLEQGHPNKSQDARRNDPWDSSRNAQPDRFSTSTWGTSAQQASRNVWGSPNNDRGLGNGTFAVDFTRAPEPPAGTISQGSAKNGPAPIAPPSSTRFPPQSASQPPPATNRSSRAPNPSLRERGEAQHRWVQAVAENDSVLRSQQATARAERDRQLEERGLSIEKAQAAIKDTWRPVNLPGDTSRTVMPGSANVIRHEPPSRPAGPPWEQQPDNRAKLDLGQVQPDAPLQDFVPATGSAAVSNSGSSAVLPSNGSSVPSQSRTSRFFPARDVRLETATSIEPERPSSPSPPPPTMAGHPAYDGDATHPHVSLPRPQPVVRLPPAPASVQNMAAQAPSFSWAHPPSYKEAPQAPAVGVRGVSDMSNIGQRKADVPVQANWQDKINNLLTGRKPSPPKSMGIEPASRNALDQANHDTSATVSLPTLSHNYQGSSASTPFTTKPMAESCFEEQEMGSLPLIRLPSKTPENTWPPAVVPSKPFPRKLLSVVTSAEPISFPVDMYGGGNVVRIKFEGMATAMSVTVPFSRTRSNPRRSGPSGRGPRGSAGGPGPRGGSKSRDASGAYSGEYSSPNGPPPPTRGGRGGFRGRGESWSRHTPPSLQA
jgi:hypothetical protein